MGSLSNQKPNKFVSGTKGYKSTIEKQISDEALNETLNGMIATKTMPTRDGGLTGRVTTPKVYEDSKCKIETWRTPADAEGYFFRARTTNKETGEVNEYMAHTEDELLGLVAQEYGKFLNEQAEIEALNNPEIPDDIEARECAWWQRHTHNGQEYKSIACGRTWQLMREALGNRPIDRVTLESAYCKVADNPDYEKNFERYFAKRDRLAAESAEQNAEATQRAEQEAAEQVRNQQEEEIFSREQKQRRNETEVSCLKDLSKSPEGMASLRRMIQAEKKNGRTPTLPSTGTGQRI